MSTLAGIKTKKQNLSANTLHFGKDQNYYLHHTSRQRITLTSTPGTPFQPNTKIQHRAQAVGMFNPKERLQQIRKNKSVREEVSSYIADTPSPPLFQQPKPNDSQDLALRISKLQNIVNELSTQLQSSKSVINSLRKENNDLETKVLKLQYQNSQLKVQTKSHQQPARKPLVPTDKSSPQKEEKEVKKSQSCVTENQQLMSEVEESLQQIKREPIESILKRKEHNFRALKADPRQINSGNKVLKEFAAICKDYHKTLKKPLLVLQLQSSDFE